MPIRINTNIASINAQRNLGNTNRTLNTTLERLSSGLRINRAADDAAGLAIANKLNTQVRGFTQAIANAQDAGNLIATAESGIDQTTQILERVRELSIQSASDTLVNSDREKIQVEIDQLVEELDSIATTTQFNTRNLLDGSLQEGAAQEDATLVIENNARIGDTSAGAAKGNFVSIETGQGINAGDTNEDIADDIALTFRILQKDGVTAFTGVNGESIAAVATEAGQYVLEIRSSKGDSVSYLELGDGTGGAFEFDYNAEFTGAAQSVDLGNAATTFQINFNTDAVNLSDADVGQTSTVQLTGARAAITDDNALTFQVGANEGQYLRAGIQDMRARALRVEGLNIVGADDDESRLRAQNAIGVVDQALDYVNTTRSRIGAYQNRIESRRNTLQVSRENLTASESRIRDADIAEETANLTRAQILVQAGTAVLTQANITPQSALNLL